MLKASLSAAALVFTAVALTGCPQPVATCSPANCVGCCTQNDECVLATSAVSCGGSGSMCMQCQPGQQCLFGLCGPGTSSTGGGNGASTGGGGGSSTGGGGGSMTGGGGGSMTGGGGGSVTGGGGGSVTGGGGGSVTGGGGGATGGGGGSTSTDAGVGPMRLFITSVAQTGSFGGLAQADALCNTSAQAANKGGTWKAWLSDSSTNALSRIADVGPWVQERPDGGTILTFNNKANLSTTPLAGISLDEQGRVLTNTYYWTGTNGGGTTGSTCGSWTSISSGGTYGAAGSTNTAWTASSNGSTSCSSNLSLLCFEETHLPAPTPVPATRKRLFITSVTQTGSFGGLAQADALCNTAAQAGNKGGTWKAWLSDSSTNALSRIADVGPWVQERPDGGTILTFNNKANLSTTPLAGISLDEQGRVLTNSFYWTGTNGGGTTGSTCGSWTSSSSGGTYGSAGSTSTNWTANSNGSTSCTSSLSLLCFEQ